MKTNLKKEVDWKELESSDLFFTPKEEPILLNGIHPTGWRSIYRDKGTATPSLIGIKSKDYALIHNKNIHEIIMNHPTIDFKLNLEKSANHKDKKMQMVYDVNVDADLGLDETQDPNGGKIQLITGNSYDGTTHINFTSGIFRWICANMLNAPVKGKVYSVKTKHSIGNFGEGQKQLEMKIFSLLDELYAPDMFDSIKTNITKMKQTENIVMDESFFKNIPMKYAIIFSTIIQKYYENELRVNTKDNGSIELKSENDVESFIEYLAKDNKNEKDYTNLLGRYNNELTGYEEKVYNSWLLYNAMIKVAQQTAINQYQKYRWSSYLTANMM